MMTIDNQGVIAEKDEETSLCDMCANAAECYDSSMVVDACSSYRPNESENDKTNGERIELSGVVARGSSEVGEITSPKIND